jgi:putative peptidoglycan lipid II flippase
MYSLGIIFGTVALPKSWGVDRLAVGVLIGAGGHLLLQLPSLFRLPERAYHAAVGLKDKAVRQVLKLMLPRLIGAGVVQLNFVANTIIALSLGEGAASAVVLAFTLMMMPQRAYRAVSGDSFSAYAFRAGGVGAVRPNARDHRENPARNDLLALPASAGLILLRVPLVRVLYERGEFSPESTRLVAWALLWYAAGLVGHSLVEVLSRAFYALHDTRTPVMVGVGAMSLNIALSFLLAAWFRSIGWMPHGGLALANSAATGLESLLLLELLRRRLKGMEGRRILHGTAAALAASALMSLAVFGWLALLPR